MLFFFKPMSTVVSDVSRQVSVREISVDIHIDIDVCVL